MSSNIEMAAAAPDAVTDQRQLFLLVFPPIMLPIFLAVVDGTIVTTALPAMAASFGAVQRISWVVVGYLVANTIAAPVYGRLADMFGRRQLMQMAIGLFCAASVLCALSTSLPMLVLARVLQGLGGGGLMTLSQALIGERVPARQRGHFQGYLAAVIVFASTFGPVAGGFLTEAFGWPSVFWVNLPVGLLAMVLVQRLPQASHVGSRASFDGMGLVWLVLSIAPLLLGLDQMQRLSVSGVPLIAGLLAVATISAIILVRHEQRIGAPLIPVRLLRDPSIWRANAMAGFSGGSLTALVTFLPIYLQVVGGASPSATGYLMLPLTAGVGIGSLVAGRLISATGRTALIPGLSFLVTFAAYVAAGVWAAQLDRVELAWLLAAGGFFQGTAMPVAQITVQHLAGPRLLGAAAGSVQLTRSLGSALGVSVVGMVLFATLASRDNHAATVFADMVEQGKAAMDQLPAAAQESMRSQIVLGFRAAFFTISTFSASISLLAWTMPLRRA
ncbi:MAG TPA: MFS transporter [Rhodopila sp.]|nr:MFS transporter [Rhodopila sp.]